MEVLVGKSSINGPFSMAMLNNQRVPQFAQDSLCKLPKAPRWSNKTTVTETFFFTEVHWQNMINKKRAMDFLQARSKQLK